MPKLKLAKGAVPQLLMDGRPIRKGGYINSKVRHPWPS